MKGGQTPIHIQRFAPADLHADEHFRLLESRRAYMVAYFYRQFIDYSFMAGGDLPADAERLAAAVRMPRRDVENALAFCLDKLVFRDGDRLYQRRVRREVKKELQFRSKQRKLGEKGGRPKKANKEEGKPKGTLSDTKSPPSPTPDADAMRLTPTPTPAPAPDGAALHPPDRSALEAECHRLVREIAAATGKDPTEVMAEGSTWNGRRKLNPASMTFDRLQNTVLDLRRMRAGQPAHPTPPSPRASSRQDTAMALINGGRRERTDLDQGNGAPGGELEGARPDPGDGDPPRGHLPAKAGPSQR